MADHPEKLETRVKRLERRLAELDRLLAARDRATRGGHLRDVQLAITWSEDEESYPAPGANTYPIIFCDGDFTESDGVQSLTAAQRSAAIQRHAYDVATGDRFLPRGTKVLVGQTRNLKRRWWILAAVDNRRRKAVTDEEITANGSGDVTCEDNDETVEAQLNWMHGGESVPANTQVIIEWFGDEAKWVIVSRACEAEES